VLREDGAEFAKNNNLEALFHVDDPGPRVPIKKGRFLDVNEALEVVRFDIQYCDWRARQDLLTIMVLHNKVRPVLAQTSETCFVSVCTCCISDIQDARSDL
jgi:chlorophyllide a oxygenase